MSSSDGRHTPDGSGVCVWLTGPSGAGKSTVTKELLPLLEKHGRTVTVLDVVDVLRKLPCERTSEGKLLRKAFVAGEVVRHGGVAICVTVSARRETRETARSMIGPEQFVEVLVEAPPGVTSARKAGRNRKPSLGKRAKGAVRPLVARVAFRGRSAYEPPLAPDLTIDTTSQTPADGARAIIRLLEGRGSLAPVARPTEHRTEATRSA